VTGIGETVEKAAGKALKSPPKRLGPAQLLGRALNSQHRQFADLVLAGMPGGAAYQTLFSCKSRDVADVQSAKLLATPKVASYISAVKDQAVENVVLSQSVLHGHAMAIARGGDDIGPGMQMEAIRYLDGCLNRNRTIRVEGLTLRLDVDESHVAAIAYAALEAEAKGEMGSEDARHLIESAAMVQQIMHGHTVGDNGASAKGVPPEPDVGSVTNHANGDVTWSLGDPRPVRPRWLKTPEQIAAQAKTRSEAGKKAVENGKAKKRQQQEET
jgi:hypothetical protein